MQKKCTGMNEKKIQIFIYIDLDTLRKWLTYKRLIAHLHDKFQYSKGPSINDFTLGRRGIRQKVMLFHKPI